MASETVIGLAACICAALLFGTVFVPIKKFDAGDGIYAQWIMTIAVWMVGFIVYIVRNTPPLYPLAMIGGVLWTLGNSCCFAIMDEVGMAIGILLWSTVSLTTGWATSRFGWFGQLPNPPKSPIVNYIGVVLVLMSGIFYVFVKSVTKDRENDDYDNLEKSPKRKLTSPSTFTYALPGRDTIVKKEAPMRKAIAVIAAIVCGFLFGNICVPANYMMDHADELGTPKSGLDYIFSQFCGIICTSTIIFIVYGIIKKNKPFITPKITLPSLVSGTFLGCGLVLLFIANENLSQSISFPIVVQLPGCVATLWSILYFKEIQGAKNFILVGVAFALALTGVTMVALSREMELF